MDLRISKSWRRNRICIVAFIFETDNFLKHTSVSFSIQFSYHISKCHHFSMPYSWIMRENNSFFFKCSLWPGTDVGSSNNKKSDSLVLSASSIILLAWHCRCKIQNFNSCYLLEVHQFKKAHALSFGRVIIRRTQAVRTFVSLTNCAWNWGVGLDL